MGYFMLGKILPQYKHFKHQRIDSVLGVCNVCFIPGYMRVVSNAYFPHYFLALVLLAGKTEIFDDLWFSWYLRIRQK